MTMQNAIRELPRYAETELPPPQPSEPPIRHRIMTKEEFERRYGLLLLLAAAFTIYSVLLCAYVAHRTEKRVQAEDAERYAAELQAYKDQQAYDRSAEYFLSGEASREAAINKATDAVAGVISKLTTDQQKLTEAACMLARVMNPAYPGSFEEVAAQPQQWMFYDGSDKTFSQHDRDLADSIVRPYMESGIIPNGLTADMVYGAWSQNDFVLRDSYQNTSTMHTWRAN